MQSIKETEKTYSVLWKKSGADLPVERWHFDAMQRVIREPIVRGNIGIEVGSGCGYDTHIMASRNKNTVIVSMDISDGIYKTKEYTKNLKNVFAVKGSALAIPVKGSIFDFAYSFGVLHHTPDPRKGLEEIARVLRKGCPAFLYLYEDHDENLIKYLAVSVLRFVRFFTTRIPKKLLYLLSWLFSPFVFFTFSVPSKFLRLFGPTKTLASKIPFNFGTTPLSLQGSIYDRFGAPIEYRFGRNETRRMFEEYGFYNITVTRLVDTAGWVVWGYKA